MAKSFKGKTATEKYLYPSRFGSHASMLNEVATEELGSEGLVVLTDEWGDYKTEEYRLDNGLNDPNRNDYSRYEEKTKNDK